MNIQYNAIDYAQQLEAAGVSKAQAEVHAKALELVVSHCADVHDVKTELSCEITELGTGLRSEIAKVDSGLRAEIAKTETKLRAEMHEMEMRLRTEIHEVEARLTRRIDIIDQKLRFQQWINGLIVAMLIGLYVQAYFR